MADRSSLAVRALLVAVVAGGSALALAVSVLQHPPTPPPRPPATTPVPPPTSVITPTPAANGPVSAFGYSVVDDPAIHRVLLFGGVDSYEETWLWDGTRWSLAHPLSHPPGRFHAAAAYDPTTRLVMLFGGRLAPGEVVNDTWAWDGTTWHELDSGSNGPGPGEGALMAWDDANGGMVLIAPGDNATGAATWVWSGTHWLRQPRGDLAGSSIAAEMSFDPVTRALILVSPLLPPTGAGATTWRWSGASWQLLRATPPTATTGLSLDPVSGRLLLCSDPTASAGAQLWSWTGTGWNPVPNSDLSAELDSDVTDLDRGQFLMLGASTPATQGAPQPVHVWGWSGSAWQQLD